MYILPQCTLTKKPKRVNGWISLVVTPQEVGRKWPAFPEVTVGSPLYT